jgi:hypothetical protein
LSGEEKSIVDDLLKRWGSALERKVGHMSLVEREQELVREVRETLECDLCSEDQKTLRWIVTGSEGEAAAFQQDLLVTRIIAHAERLHDTLARHHHAWLEFGEEMPDAKGAMLHDLEEVRVGLYAVRSGVHSHLMRAKERSDKENVRSLGRSLNDLHALLRRLEADKCEVTRNSRLATLLITVCRRVLPARTIKPAQLTDIPPSRTGFLKILDFYFFSDATQYCFGDNFSGPNWFTRLKGNVAILSVADSQKRTAYNQFAVSGVHQKPGAQLVPDDCSFQASEAADERGRLFNRRNDAEIKLLSAFAQAFACDFAGSGVLWTLKPLCTSCASVVCQFRERFPGLCLEVVVESSLVFKASCRDHCKRCICDPLTPLKLARIV